MAAFPKIIDTYPTTNAAVAARYYRASALMSLGRMPEAEQAFQAAGAAAGSSIYAPMAKLGQAEALVAAGDFGKGVALLETLAADRDGNLPVDGVLMQLAAAYQKAGKAAEARTSYKRVVDEFPDSVYVAKARQELGKIG